MTAKHAIKAPFSVQTAPQLHHSRAQLQAPQSEPMSVIGTPDLAFGWPAKPWTDPAATSRAQEPFERNHPVGRRRIGALREFAPLLGLLDLAVAILGTAVLALVLDASALIYAAGPALWWLLVACAGGYSRFRNRATSIQITLKAVGGFSFIALISTQILPISAVQMPDLLILIAQSALLTAIGRTLLRMICPNRVMVVTCGDDELHPSATSVLNIEQLQTSPDSLVTRVVRQAQQSAATIVQVEPGARLDTETIQRLTWELRHDNISLRFNFAAGPVAFRRTQSVSDGSSIALEVRSPRASILTRSTKRMLDLCGGGLIMLLLSPVLLVLAVLVKITSTGPILYRQERVGKDGVPFMMTKFRTMIVNADDQLAELLAAQGKGDKPLFKIDNDPRMTKVGAILRKFSLDELPQLLNVIGGSMSLVGPRPQRQPEVELYDTLAAQRLGVSPGMTGLWQVSGRSRLTWEEAIALDVNYAHNWSVTHDISILLRTVKAVISGDGAV